MPLERYSRMARRVMKWCQGRLCASTIDQVASAALYSVGPEYFAAVREEYRARRDALVEGLKKIPGVVYSAPKGAFYVMSRASDFRLLDRKAVDVLLTIREKHAFFRALSSWVGYKTAAVEFDVQERAAGSSKWSGRKLTRYAITNITSFSTAPMN